MKIIALLLLILGVAVTGILGFFYFFLFIMSFDAPGSDKDAQAWMFRMVMFLPIILSIAALVFAFLAYKSGNYHRSAGIGSVFGLGLVAGAIYVIRLQRDNTRYVDELRAQQLEEQRHPLRTFLRPVEGGVDTILVFPSRIVAYRVLDPRYPQPVGGPIGDLNETRDTVLLTIDARSHVQREEFEQFTDENGQKFSEAFQFRN